MKKLILIMVVMLTTVTAYAYTLGTSRPKQCQTDWGCVSRCTAQGNLHGLCVDKCTWCN